MHARPSRLDQHVVHRPLERQVGEAVIVDVADLAAAQMKLGAARAVRDSGDARPATNLGDHTVAASLHVWRSTTEVAAMRVVLDWDGTVTMRDSLWMLLDEFGDREIFAQAEKDLGKTLSYREVMEMELATIRVPFEEALTFLLDSVVVREGFHELAATHNPLILSGGFHQTIEPLLVREGVSLDVKANRINPRRDGWLIEWRDPEPCEVCGELCKRRNLPTDRPMAYIGDGYSDRCAALAADRIFARDALARHLEAEGVPFERFDTLTEVVAALAA